MMWVPHGYRPTLRTLSIAFVLASMMTISWFVDSAR